MVLGRRDRTGLTATHSKPTCAQSKAPLLKRWSHAHDRGSCYKKVMAGRYDAEAIYRIPPSRRLRRQRQIIEDDLCPICKRFSKTPIHALWECGATQDVWAGYSHRTLQKGLIDQGNVLQLFEILMHKLTEDVLEFFLVQSWLIWHQRNLVLHGGNLQEPSRLNAQASSFLAEYKEAQSQLAVPVLNGLSQSCQPPYRMLYKLNFDAAVFTDITASGVGVIIRNERGQVMAALLLKGPAVTDTEEAEVLAC
ncbi:hypothetical protein SO802_005015 [Lithocarpus litseifolius]|uniref:RNase H type-1 domain-containing protein n=1 Tax=Lithocarpus litseifolius TaxID=425828 RepID=A0AAW2DGZ9_9ROSI